MNPTGLKSNHRTPRGQEPKLFGNNPLHNSQRTKTSRPFIATGTSKDNTQAKDSAVNSGKNSAGSKFPQPAQTRTSRLRATNAVNQKTPQTTAFQGMKKNSLEMLPSMNQSSNLQQLDMLD